MSKSDVKHTNHLPRRVGLPYDVYATIADIVAGDWAAEDPAAMEALKALALTSRSLVHLSLKHLFSEVSVSEKSVTRYPEISQHALHLVDHVRILILMAEENMERGKWTYPSELVFKFLRLFHKLQLMNLDFGAENKHSTPLRWDKLCPIIAASILGLLRSQPNLISLSIDLVNRFPLHTLWSLSEYSPELRDVILRGVTTDDEDPRITFHTVPSKVEKWTVGVNTYKTLEKFAKPSNSTRGNDKPLDYSMIKDLTIAWKTLKDVAATKRLLKFTNNVWSLTCELHPSSSVTFEGLGQTILEGPFRLQVLEFRVPVNVIPLEYPLDTLYDVDTELMRLSGNKCSIEEIIIDLEFDIVEEIDITRTCATFYERCKVLNKILSQKKGFPKLWRISINFQLNIPNDYNVTLEELEKAPWKPASRMENECLNDLKELFALEFAMKIEWESDDPEATTPLVLEC